MRNVHTACQPRSFPGLLFGAGGVDITYGADAPTHINIQRAVSEGGGADHATAFLSAMCLVIVGTPPGQFHMHISEERFGSVVWYHYVCQVWVARSFCQGSGRLLDMWRPSGFVVVERFVVEIGYVDSCTFYNHIWHTVFLLVGGCG